MNGSCVCGSVRYECEGEAVMAAHCHCRDCQRSSGAAAATIFAVAKTAFKLLEGKTAIYSYKGESGREVIRHFCPNCGAPLFTDVASMPELKFVRATSLDDPALVKPTMHIYCNRGQPWGEWRDDLPHYAELPF